MTINADGAGRISFMSWSADGSITFTLPAGHPLIKDIEEFDWGYKL